ncbi:MAG: hypothetical protein LQ348_001456 [Seirophora lacunosa]|nr:MAG: hypothetical protein LQ348_001456 [Seirophora lacunosa]
MNTHGEPRERSPAYRGARLAFSSPVASSKSLNNSDNRGRGALVAANRVGIWKESDNGNPQNVDKGRVTATTQQPKNDTSPYIAANLAARQSTEQLPLSKAIPPPMSWSRPAHLRAHSDLTIRRNTNTPSMNTLVSHYEREDADQMSLQTVLNSPQRRVSPLDAQARRSHLFAKEPRGSSSSSAEFSSGAPAVDETLSQGSGKDAYCTSHPAKPRPKPSRNSTSVLLPTSTVPQLSVSSLANAMVASSLASSRAPSPKNSSHPPLPPPRRRSRPHLFHRTHSADNDRGDLRTPSPSKGIMRQTMRAPLEPAEDLSGKHSRNRFINKHPNKHHEGDRKRWRDQITELERKRYEGVWAANKGLFTSTYGNESSRHVDLGNCVLNIIVRDIWSRSKLPTDILEDVWDLVTSNRDTGGLLSKEEFVVGMWLVDQRLKGRKLPGKVSDSVWFSARGLTGINVKRRH